MATKTAVRARMAKTLTPSAKKAIPASQKAARVVRKPAPKRQPLARKTIDPGWTWDDGLPLAQARQVGNTIYLSGQAALDAEGRIIGEGNMKAQVHKTFANIKEVLAAAGAGMEDIVKITTYITDQSKFMEMLEARKEVFGAKPPASTAVVVAGLAFPKMLVEIEAIAVKS